MGLDSIMFPIETNTKASDQKWNYIWIKYVIININPIKLFGGATQFTPDHVLGSEGVRQTMITASYKTNA